MSKLDAALTVERDPGSQLMTEALMDHLLEKLRDAVGADTAAVLLFDVQQQFLVAVAARGIEEEVRQGARVRTGTGFAGTVAATRRPVILDEVSPATVVNPLLLRRGISAMLGVPLMHDDHVLGVLHVGSLAPRRFGPVEVRALEQAAAGIAAALVRHRAFVDRAAATALQNSLASRLPDIDGLELAARYVAGSQYGIGGDWYDVFTLPGSELVALTIGDVMGHGLHAATVMGRVRSALRAYAIDEPDPARVLERLDRKMQHFEPGLIGTVLYAVFDPATGRLTLSSAGHLPPMRGGTGEAPGPLALPVDPPIGAVRSVSRRSTTVQLGDRAVLCLYTDGLVETRTSDITEQLGRLAAVVGDTATASADALCAEIMTTMLGERHPTDDISLLVLRRYG